MRRAEFLPRLPHWLVVFGWGVASVIALFTYVGIGVLIWACLQGACP